MSVLFNFPDWKIKALTMSYDDGVVQDRRLIEIFNRYGLKGTFHLNSGLFDRDNRVNPDEVKSLYKGHEISCHGVTHNWPTQQPAGEVMREVWEDRKILEQLAGYPVTGMSYPFGNYNRESIDILRAAGIVYCRTTRATESFDLPGDFLAWHPTCHHRSMLDLAHGFIEKNRYPMRLFYLWGHAYEFDNNDNWQDMEKFAAMIAGRDNIWYATNLEIYRYIQALRSVVSSTDGRLFYNPSAIPVYCFDANDQYVIAPGETLCLD